MLRITKSSTTGLIDRALEAGLVTRDVDAQDRRSHVVNLTDRGRELGASYRGLVTEQVAVLIADLPVAECELLRSALSRVVVAGQARETWPSSSASAA